MVLFSCHLSLLSLIGGSLMQKKVTPKLYALINLNRCDLFLLVASFLFFLFCVVFYAFCFIYLLVMFILILLPFIAHEGPLSFWLTFFQIKHVLFTPIWYQGKSRDTIPISLSLYAFFLIEHSKAWMALQKKTHTFLKFSPMQYLQ